jgi:hypothetical protein
MWRICLFLAAALAVAASATVVAQQPSQHMQGRVVLVYPDVDTLVLRVGEGNKAKNIEYKVNKNTRYWDADAKGIVNGLRNPGFKEGADVWFKIQPKQSQQLIGEVWFYNPAGKDK